MARDDVYVPSNSTAFDMTVLLGGTRHLSLTMYERNERLKAEQISKIFMLSPDN